MSANAPLGIGMLGNGFMAKAHTKALLDTGALRNGAPRTALISIAGRNEASLVEACQQYGWESYTTDWREQVNDPRIGLFHNTGPNALHVEPTVAALRAGKHVLCEKPLAAGADDAFHMWQTAASAGVTHMCGFNFRFAPAVRLAHDMVEAGEIGDIIHFRAQFLESSGLDDRAITWRDSATEAGSGAIGDLGSHIIDLARWLAGELVAVQAFSRTVIPQRGSDRVEVDDAFGALVDFEGGAGGVLEASRVAGGFGSRCAFEIDGTLGSVRFTSERLNDLEHAGRDRVIKTIRVTGAAHPFMELWWPNPGHVVGWGDTFTHEVDHLLAAIAGRSTVAPLGADFGDGYRCAEVCDALLRATISNAREPITYRSLDPSATAPDRLRAAVA
jgi:predicted dehydrogenase